MKARLLFRIASVLFVLFAAGHTFGFLTLKPPTPEAAAVREAMDRVQFLGGRSFGGFYVGFGLDITAYLLLSAFLAWHLGNLAEKAPQAIGAIGWSFLAVQVAGGVISCIYIGVPPAAFSAIAAICLGWATWLAKAALPKPV